MAFDRRRMPSDAHFGTACVSSGLNCVYTCEGDDGYEEVVEAFDKQFYRIGACRSHAADVGVGRNRIKQCDAGFNSVF